MKGLIGILLMAVALSGCVSTRSWYNSKKSYEERQKDYMECRYEADKYTAAPQDASLYANYAQVDRHNRLYSQCLALRGYAMFENIDIAKIEADRKK